MHALAIMLLSSGATQSCAHPELLSRARVRRGGNGVFSTALVLPKVPWLQSTLPRRHGTVTLPAVRLRLENLPVSRAAHRDTIARCLEAKYQVTPLRAGYLFGSHARGDARLDSDVDLCLVSDGATRQLEASTRFSDAIWDVLPLSTKCPACRHPRRDRPPELDPTSSVAVPNTID